MRVKYVYDWGPELLNIRDDGYISEAYFSSSTLIIDDVIIEDAEVSCRINTDDDSGIINHSIKTSNGNCLVNQKIWKAP